MIGESSMRMLFVGAMVAFGSSLICMGQRPPEPETFFRTKMHLSAGQINDIRRGKVVARILTSPGPSVIFVFGAVYIRAEPEAYLQFARDIERLRRTQGYLVAGEFSNPPQVADMDTFSLEPNDIKELKKCKLGSCELQLPEESMEDLKKSIDWSASDVAEQVNRRAKAKTVEALRAYQKWGNSTLGIYRDKGDPLPVGEQFKSLLSRVDFLPQYLPDLFRYMLDYPATQPLGIRDFFYWEKVNFGMKPTVRVNHAILYRTQETGQEVYALAIKQLYATHYFQTALDLSFCVRESESRDQSGFYLITVKGSRQAGLTGLKGRIIRQVAVGKTRTSLERALNGIKNLLEHPIELRPK